MYLCLIHQSWWKVYSARKLTECNNSVGKSLSSNLLRRCLCGSKHTIPQILPSDARKLYLQLSHGIFVILQAPWRLPPSLVKVTQELCVETLFRRNAHCLGRLPGCTAQAEEPYRYSSQGGIKTGRFTSYPGDFTQLGTLYYFMKTIKSILQFPDKTLCHYYRFYLSRSVSYGVVAPSVI